MAPQRPNQSFVSYAIDEPWTIYCAAALEVHPVHFEFQIDGQFKVGHQTMHPTIQSSPFSWNVFTVDCHVISTNDSSLPLGIVRCFLFEFASG